MQEEKRRARRFDLQLPVTVTAIGEKRAQAAVRTRDISSSGMFIEFDDTVQAGTSVELTVDLPQELTQAGSVRLRCMGHVIRVDRGKAAHMGVAVRIERYEFMRREQSDPEIVN